jgi:hypothetical protein
MFCPRCGSNQSEELKFCKLCGANLYAVRQVVDNRETGKKFDWGETWVAEMFLSGPEAERRKAEIERQRGITPEVKRYNEIKAGVIASSVGIAIAIFLNVFMPGIIMSGKVDPAAAEILRRVWIAGVIPFAVGLALIFNGLVVSRKLVELSRRADSKGPDSLESGTNPLSLRAADTTGFSHPGSSITEETTRHLRSDLKR